MKKVLLILVSFYIFAHEGHETPGAIPPAPNGGVLNEAKHIHHGSKKGHDHHKEMKREIFFEGRFVNDGIRIYPLELGPKNFKVFTELKTSQFKNIKFKIMDARKNKELEAKVTQDEKSWSLLVKSKRVRRFIVHIDGLLGEARYQAKAQIERK